MLRDTSWALPTHSQGHEGNSGAGVCAGDRSAIIVPIFSRAASMENMPRCAPRPPGCRDVNRVTAGDARGSCYCCTGISTKGGCADEDSGGATVAGAAGGSEAGNTFDGAIVTGVGSCCCGTDDAEGRGVDEDSAVTPVDGVDGWYHTSKPLAGSGDPAIAVPPPTGARP